jgi:hypothetical protein
MSDTLHTYHPTLLHDRGIHALTTSDHDEAFAMLHAVALKEALRDVLAWRDTIIAAIGTAHGEGSSTYRRVAADLYHAEAVLSASGKYELPH